MSYWKLQSFSSRSCGPGGHKFLFMFLSLCKGLHGKVEMVLSDLKIYKKINFYTANTQETVPSAHHMAAEQLPEPALGGNRQSRSGPV